MNDEHLSNLILPSEQLAETPLPEPGDMGLMDLFNGYVLVFTVGFLITLALTPLFRHLAISNGIIDRPTDPRKAHRVPVAYLGGVSVFLGMLGALLFAYVGLAGLLPESAFSSHVLASIHDQDFIPPSILLGMVIITITGLIDDVVGLDPRLKVVGQLIAAAALALNDFGVRVAEGAIMPVVRALDLPTFETGAGEAVRQTFGFVIESAPLVGTVEVDFVYWIGTAIIAVCVLGGCNASNLIDGLDGLLSGVTAIAAAGLLVIALLLAAADDGPRDAARIVMCLALLGGCLGFLPHNFRPATIFLGDCGSLLMGYMAITIVLSLGDTGKTHIVIAGLIIYAIPIIDTALAIVRRKMAGMPMSAPDAQHLHHMLKRKLGVVGAVLTLYGLGIVFAILGVWLSTGPIRLVFTIAMVIAGCVGVAAVKAARRQTLEAAALRSVGGITTSPAAEYVSGDKAKASQSSEQPATP